jgi:hypothetical protein
VKKLIYITLFCLMAVLPWVYFHSERFLPVQKDHFSILLVNEAQLDERALKIRAAYVSVFEEEGIPLEFVLPSTLITEDPIALLAAHPAILFPDGLARRLPVEFALWSKRYVGAGGNIAVIYDPGVISLFEVYNKRAVFAEMVGVNYMLYEKLTDDTYTEASVQFRDMESAERFQFPPGKVCDDHFVCGYQHDKLSYHVVRNEPRPDLTYEEIHAYAMVGEKEHYPAIVLRSHGKGHVLYVNMQLGMLKAFSTDDLWMRAMMRTFLFDVVRIPHLVNTPEGKGGIVFNWHMDDKRERDNIPAFAKRGYLRENLPSSIHFTAGEFVEYPTDREGFDACGKGRDVVALADRYGNVGSHGGWRHNWFAFKIQEGEFGADEIREYIQKNSECVSSVTGYPVTEYSAPVGVHPQPMATHILGELGIVAYYYTGDAGSGPNRAFIKGEMVSDKVIAFPVLSLGVLASFFEMDFNNVPAEVLQSWLLGIADYTTRQHTVRLLYSHLYDLADYKNYQEPFGRFLDQMEKLQDEGKLLVRPMTYFANFFLRFLKTKSEFQITSTGMTVSLENPDGLRGVTTAIPKMYYQSPTHDAIRVWEDNDYYFAVVNRPIYQIKVRVDRLVENAMEKPAPITP